MSDEKRLPMVGDGDLRLKIEQNEVDGGQTREFTHRRAAHAPDLRYNLLCATKVSAVV